LHNIEQEGLIIVVYLTSSCVNWGFLTSAKKAQLTHERVEYNVLLFDEPLKGSKLLKIFKISLTFRFDKLSNLSKSVHIEENSQILTVSNKKQYIPGVPELPHDILIAYSGVKIKTRIERKNVEGLYCKRFSLTNRKTFVNCFIR
jgi:hypothetical protein